MWSATSSIPDCRTRPAAGRGEGFDGVTVQWFRDLDAFNAMISDPEYRRIVGPDERELLDRAGSVYLLTDEPRVVFDRYGPRT